MSGKKYTAYETNYIIENYADMPTLKISEILGRNSQSISNKARLLGIKKSVEYLNSPFSGRLTPGSLLGGKTKFKKGHIPQNKGKKMPEAVYSKVKRTMFKKGNLPVNTKRDGEITVRHDKANTPYLYVRISKAVWRPLHQVIWEKHNGKIQRGQKIIFINKNFKDIRIENLKLVTCAELMTMNTRHRYPEEINKLIQAKSVLTRQINKILQNE